MTENEIAKIVLDCALKVHKRLGPGLLESAYTECLCYEIYQAGLFVEKEKPMSLEDGEIQLNVGYRTDIVVENKFIIEVKVVDNLKDIHLAQLLTYLKLSGCKLGFLINFNVVLLKDGVRRVINGKL
ncbi:GxxExxY protein [Flavobacterium sp. RNTU_13]|uniref:GxxExxY protein n=1 Tax=Flavobacterium sp. RNTU_13 TaxID=3375145 RepID=UPI003986E235